MSKCWLVAFVVVMSAAVAHGDDPYGRSAFWQSCCTPGRICPTWNCCPDLYVHKPCPPIVPLQYCGGPDHYCRKREPDIRVLPRTCVPDDYCRKPLPTLLCPPHPASYGNVKR
jgi:hypothetical protein